MKKFLMATAATALCANAAFADGHGEVKIGLLLSYTGDIESLVPPISDGAELAIKEIDDAGVFLGNTKIISVKGDTTCSQPDVARAAAERLISVERIDGVVGSDCSGVTTAILTNVAVPNGMVMISPAATTPALTTAEDNGLFFRTAPSDARQGELLASLIIERGIKEVAVTYTQNDYGTGFADALVSSYVSMGGKVTLSASHAENKADYSSEVGALASAGGEALVVLGYVDGGGSQIIQSALDLGAFDAFVVGDGMIGDTLTDNFGDALDGAFGTAPGGASDGAAIYQKMAGSAGFDGSSVYSAEGYDAAAILLLAMQAANSSKPSEYAAQVMNVANAPGEAIFPGELAKALEILNSGGEIDYQGASAVEFVGPGEAGGTYNILEVQNGSLNVLETR